MQCRRHRRWGFNPWIGKISWRRAWQPTLVFLPGESHGQKSVMGYSPWGRRESDMTGAIEYKIASRSWQGMRGKTQKEEKPEKTVELTAVIMGQKQEKIAWRRQQSQKHRRGNWKMFCWKPEEDSFTLLNCAGQKHRHELWQLSFSHIFIQSIRKSSWPNLPNLFSLTNFHPCHSHKVSSKPSSPPASDGRNHPCFYL